MSQGATDASVLMLTGGATVSMIGLTAAVLMYVSQYADPVVCGLVFGAPTALVLALARLAKRAKPAPDVHQHYTGPVYQDQRTVHSRTAGVWAKTNNQHYAKGGPPFRQEPGPPLSARTRQGTGDIQHDP